MASVGFSSIPLTDCTETTRKNTLVSLARQSTKISGVLSLSSGSDLQLSEGVVTLLLTRSLLGAHGDELVDAVGHSPVDTEEEEPRSGQKDRALAK